MMKYVQNFKGFKYDDGKVQWLKVFKVKSKTDNEIIHKLTEIGKKELFDIFYFDEDQKTIFIDSKLDSYRPVLRYGGLNKEIIAFLDKQDIDKEKVYNYDVEAIKISGDKKIWHETLGDKEYIPKTVFTIDDTKDLKYPIIAKPAIGHSGIGIMKFDNIEDLKASKEKFDVYSECVKIEREYRAMYVNDKIFTIYERIAMISKNKTIETKGIKEEVFYVYFPIELGKFELLEKWEEISEDVTSKINLHFYSLDFLVDAENNSWVMESNSASGLGCYSLAAGYEALYRDFHQKNPPPEKMKVVNLIKDTYTVELRNFYPREYNKSIASK